MKGKNMSKRQEVLIVVILVLAALVGFATAANAESLYLPAVSVYEVSVEATYTACGSPIAGVEVWVDAFDGENRIQLTTDANGVARWSGINNNSVIYVSNVLGQGFLFQSFVKTVVSFEYCDGVSVITPKPIQ